MRCERRKVNTIKFIRKSGNVRKKEHGYHPRGLEEAYRMTPLSTLSDAHRFNDEFNSENVFGLPRGCVSVIFFCVCAFLLLFRVFFLQLSSIVFELCVGYTQCHC
jgi:hypothetical protein